MAAQEAKPNTDKGTAAATSQAEARRARWWARQIPTTAFAAILVVTVVVHGLLFASHRSDASPAVKADEEVLIGQFRYVPRTPQRADTPGVVFQLHVRLLEEVKSTACARLGGRKYKVRQDVETLLRQAHPDDFTDPVLAGLKRQLQEQINESLEVRGIAEVIITGLTFADRRRDGTAKVEVVPPADSPPVSSTSGDGLERSAP